MTEANRSNMYGGATGRLVVAVISDLHAYTPNEPGRIDVGRNSPSYLATPGSGSTTLIGDPYTHLLELIRKRRIVADIVLCPGDLGDIASEPGIRYAWTCLRDVAAELQATLLAATPGNHDIDHRGVESDGCLRSLEDFPVPNRDARLQFWADHYTVLDGNLYRILCLNSCAHHRGEGPQNNHGHIVNRTLSSIDEELERLERKPIQMLLCHHHPHQHCEFALGEHDVMKGGQLLLDRLAKHGHWMVIHGHKHHPKLTRAAGGSMAPWVFAAGSLACHPNPATVGHARNQFYTIEFDLETFSDLGWGGRIYAWDWSPENGWAPATASSGLPSEVGFGYQGYLERVATEMLNHLPERSTGYLRWPELIQFCPTLQRMCPQDIRELSSRSGIAIEYDAYGVPSTVSRTQ